MTGGAISAALSVHDSCAEIGGQLCRTVPRAVVDHQRPEARGHPAQIHGRASASSRQGSNTSQLILSGVRPTSTT